MADGKWKGLFHPCFFDDTSQRKVIIKQLGFLSRFWKSFLLEQTSFYNLADFLPHDHSTGEEYDLGVWHPDDERVDAQYEVLERVLLEIPFKPQEILQAARGDFLQQQAETERGLSHHERKRMAAIEAEALSLVGGRVQVSSVVTLENMDFDTIFAYREIAKRSFNEGVRRAKRSDHNGANVYLEIAVAMYATMGYTHRFADSVLSYARSEFFQNRESETFEMAVGSIDLLVDPRLRRRNVTRVHGHDRRTNNYLNQRREAGKARNKRTGDKARWSRKRKQERHASNLDVMTALNLLYRRAEALYWLGLPEAAQADCDRAYSVLEGKYHLENRYKKRTMQKFQKLAA